MIDKIRTSHLARRAVVYLRQSTIKQVHVHRESTARQYALRQRAIDLGWSVDHIDVVDDDLGQSGSSTHGRAGFQRLAEDVAHGRVGAVFALEVSRLSRSSADWHRLLDLCGFADVVIADEQAVYTPGDYNDRLLLGLKGTMSEAEQYWMRLRLQGGKLNKARRGELFMPPPAGYEWDEAERKFRLHPDEQVQRIVRLVFERFRLEGSAYAVMRGFAGQGLKLPVHDQSAGTIEWVPPRHGLILSILHNPTYAGAYVFGRSEERMGLVDGQFRRRRVTKLAQAAWKTCVRDRHPGYIDWEEFMANQRKLHENRSSRREPDQRGAAREGQALLQGLALCGRCGARMTVRYQGRQRRVQYECRNPTRRLGDPQVCWTVSGDSIDAAVASRFLDAVQPPELELGLAVGREAERQASEVDRQWKLRLDRVRYEARLAERRYKAVDPDNRVVARTLEREWNEKLGEIEALEHEHQEVRRREKTVLNAQDRARILALARDLPRVWNAPTTTPAERKNLLRLLVREVTLGPVEVPQRMTRVQLLWQTGAVSDFTVPRPSKFTVRATASEAVALIRELVAEQKTAAEIAVELNQRKLRTGFHRPWSARSVHWVCHRHDLHAAGAPAPSARMPDRRADGLYSVHGVAARMGVTDGVVHEWIKRGCLRGTVGGGRGRAWWFELDIKTVHRLEALKPRPRKRHPEPLREEGHCA